MNIKEQKIGRVYEDFAVGDIYPHPLGRTVTKTDNIYMTLLTQNTNAIHFDDYYSEQNINSTFTIALVTGQSVSDLSHYVMANLG